MLWLAARLRKVWPLDFSVASCFLKAILSRVRCEAVKTWDSSELGFVAPDEPLLNGFGVRGEGYGEGDEGVVGEVR
jgi:hypothetical protein